MVKEKLGIVSSYDELCGNASYTKALVAGLSEYYDVTVVPLNVEMLRNGEKRSGEAHIREVCQQLKELDCVNVQFEAGLFGSTLPSMLNRFLAIGRASKKLVLTMHRFHAKRKYPNLPMFGKALLNRGIGQLVLDFQFAYANNRYLSLYNQVIQFCKKKKAPIIVHTPKERDLIKIRCKYDQVYDHPLCFFEQDYIESIRTNNSRKSFCERYHLNEEKVYIGIFGFINKYKGHETAIKALDFLPGKYELLIFGAQHPHTIKIEESINQYIKELLKLITDKKLTFRVKFFGSLTDEEFLKALLSCDFNVLPYLEVNQGGSAIAALSLETGKKTLFSQNRAFLELAKYAPNAFKMVSIGNYLELAQAITSYCEDDYSNGLKKYHNKYNIRTSVELYRKLISGVAVPECSQVQSHQEYQIENA